MCGIYGIINLKAEAVDPGLLSRMGGVQIDRGPDDEGMHTDGACGIAMRRLSIIDLAGGHQPLSNQEGTLWLVANGEIYNFRELRRDLEAKGHRFKTGSDCESILHLYAEYGDEFVHHLNGMFGFALWDARRKRLIVARDRLGIKPIYFARAGSDLVFSSEAKALFEHPGLSAQLSLRGFASYLRLGYVSAPESIFAGIDKLPPGSLLIVENGRHEVKRYWRVPATVDSSLDEASWVEQVRAGIERSVAMQMVSDVPIGAFLSGGIDSSAVVGFMARHSSRPIKTYAIGFDGGGADAFYNELPYARQVAKQFGTEHHEIVVKPDLVSLLPKLLWHLDEPIGDSAYLTTYLVSEFARREVTVILSGVGGDELFGGYRRYLGGYYGRYFARLPGAARALLGQVSRRLPADRHAPLYNLFRYAKGFLATAELSLEEQYRSYVEVIGPELAAELTAGHRLPEVDPIGAAFAGTLSEDSLSRLFAVDAETQLPEDLLLLTDKMSMSVSLECRVPLLDHELVELAARMPESIKIKGGKLKYLMKRALKYLLPDTVLHRKKRGFGAPMGAWLREQLAPVMRGVFSEQAVAKRALFSHAGVWRLIKAHQERREDYTDHLLALLNFELWSRIYLDRRSPEDVSMEIKEMVA